LQQPRHPVERSTSARKWDRRRRSGSQLLRRWQVPATLRDRSAHRQVNVFPLHTFLGRARKVCRLPAGTGEVKVLAPILAKAQRENRYLLAIWSI
jgi:hypothetical protein